MKRVSAFVLALALFATPTLAVAGPSYGETPLPTKSPTPGVALASDWDGPSLQEIFGETYVQSIVYGDSYYPFGT